jgi:hypothetical protein
VRGELEKKRKGGGEGEERVGGRKERISDRATERERERRKHESAGGRKGTRRWRWGCMSGMWSWDGMKRKLECTSGMRCWGRSVEGEMHGECECERHTEKKRTRKMESKRVAERERERERERGRWTQMGRRSSMIWRA